MHRPDMTTTWKDLTFIPDDVALAELRRAWAWLLPSTFEPFMTSTLGDVFFQQGADEVFWLNTGTAEITRVASSKIDFLERLKTDESDEWFMPPLIAELRAAGKILKPGQCYTYVCYPIFA